MQTVRDMSTPGNGNMKEKDESVINRLGQTMVKLITVNPQNCCIARTENHC